MAAPTADRHIDSEQAAIGERMRVERVRAGLTQGELAERLGVSQGFYCKWETGTREIPVVTLAAIAAALSTDPALLAFGVPAESGRTFCSLCTKHFTGAAAPDGWFTLLLDGCVLRVCTWHGSITLGELRRMVARITPTQSEAT